MGQLMLEREEEQEMGGWCCELSAFRRRAGWSLGGSTWCPWNPFGQLLRWPLSDILLQAPHHTCSAGEWRNGKGRLRSIGA